MTDLARTEDWQRLDPRMLLVHPIQETWKFLPALVGVVVVGSAGGLGLPALAAAVFPIGIGLARYLTTSYRIAAGRIELRRGLLQRQLLSTPVDRVRTVDLTAPLVHRILGLTKVLVGTGSAVTDDDGRLELDALTAAEAAALRDRLLRAAAPATDGEKAGAVPPPEPVAVFEPRWLWYAPFTSTGLVVAGGVLGAAAQAFGEYDVRIDLDESDLAGLSTPVLVAAAVGLVGVALLVTVLGYLVTNWRLTLTRLPESWHLRRGLLTTRETSIDVDRLAGVAVGEQAGLRLARGRRLSAIVTGLDRSESGSEVLVPPAPAGVVRAAARAALGTEAPLATQLTGHGPAAVRRRFTRALVPAALLAAVPVGLVVAGWSPWLLLVSALAVAAATALAADRARGLGHALTGGHLVARSGSLLRKREMLATDHVIGWTFRATWFQRRAGLTTLSATTAGGRGAVTSPDMSMPQATALADAAVPGLVAQFVTRG